MPVYRRGNCEEIANLKRAVESLSFTERAILTLRFGLDGNEPKSPEETRVTLGFITVEDVLDIEKMALQNLRSPKRRGLL